MAIQIPGSPTLKAKTIIPLDTRAANQAGETFPPTSAQTNRLQQPAVIRARAVPARDAAGQPAAPAVPTTGLRPSPERPAPGSPSYRQPGGFYPGGHGAGGLIGRPEVGSAGYSASTKTGQQQHDAVHAKMNYDPGLPYTSFTVPDRAELDLLRSRAAGGCKLCAAHLSGLMRGDRWRQSYNQQESRKQAEAVEAERRPLQRIARAARRFGGGVGPGLAVSDHERHILEQAAQPMSNRW